MPTVPRGRNGIVLRGSAARACRHVGKGRRRAAGHGVGDGISRRRRREQSIDGELNVAYPEIGQFAARALGFAQCRCVGAADQNDGGLVRIGEAFDRGRVKRLLLLQSGKRPETGRAAGRRGDEIVPGRGQRQQSQGMSGRGGVEDDVIEILRCRRIAEQFRELVEGGDLDGARAGELLLHALDRGRRQDAPIGTDHAFAVVAGGRFRIDVEREKARHAGYRGRRLAQCRAQHFIEIGCRIGADDEDSLAGFGQGKSACAGERCLAHPALAGEESVSGSQFGEGHVSTFRFSSSRTWASSRVQPWPPMFPW